MFEKTKKRFKEFIVTALTNQIYRYTPEQLMKVFERSVNAHKKNTI